MTTRPLKRDTALQMIDKYDTSQRRAYRLVSVDPKTVRREPEPDNPGIRKCMREIAAARRRFGYRRIGIMLDRECIVMNYSEGGRGRRPRKPRNAEASLREGRTGVEAQGVVARPSLERVSRCLCQMARQSDEPRLCIGRICTRAQVPDADHDRRLHYSDYNQ
jgi:hypothetical protein